MMKIIILLLSSVVLCSVSPLFAADTNDKNNAVDAAAAAAVEKVHVIFKTHLDIGFTDLACNVENRYINEFIPGALAVQEQLRNEGVKERYVWTTGSYLIDSYLKYAPPEAVKKLEEAIRRGDIAWNSVPYTVQTEIMSADLFAETLKLAKQLDKKYGKRTIAAKMTDVPGHTRGIITPLADAEIKVLHIGINRATRMPVVPEIFRWRNTDGKEIILIQQARYGDDMILPDGKTAVSINFTGDNRGPHTVQRVKAVYADLQKKYPNAQLTGSTLNDVAEDVLKSADKLPVVTSEIGDIWIYGTASQPVMMRRYRAVSRLFSQWLKSGQLDPDSSTAVDFAVHLGLVAEHTWGVDTKSYAKFVRDKYSFDAFNSVRNMPLLRRAELSWQEKANRVDEAVELLPAQLRNEAKQTLSSLEHTEAKSENEKGIIPLPPLTTLLKTSEIAYQVYSIEDYTEYRREYLRPDPPEWTKTDYAKPGIETMTEIVSKTLTAGIDNRFPKDPAVDERLLPETVKKEIHFLSDHSCEITVSIVNKPAVRLPEAYWFSFFSKEVERILIEKTGFPVDVCNVVHGGSKQFHGIDQYVEFFTRYGKYRITSLDCPLVVFGKRTVFYEPKDKPDINSGIHFCLFNNLKGTNYAMWSEGSFSYRFRVDLLPVEP